MRAFRYTTLAAQSTPWTCRSCIQKQAIPAVKKAEYSSKARRPFKKFARRRNIVLAASTGTLGAGAAFFTDDVKHGFVAMERSGRVLTTLAICVNE